MSFTADLDVFSERRLQELCRRLMELEKDHAQRVREMWTGTLAMAFNDAELALLNEVGVLSRLDLDDLATAQRLVSGDGEVLG